MEFDSCCNRQNIILEGGIEYICKACGTVVGSKEDEHTITESTKNTKHKSNVLREGLDYSSLGQNASIISNNFKDFAGKPVKNYGDVNKLLWNNRMTVNKNDPSRQHHIKTAKRTIVMLYQKLYIPPSIAEEASRIYMKAYQKKLIKGRNIEGIAAAALYIASKINGLTKTLDEFASILQTKTIDKDNTTNIKYIIHKPKRKIRKNLFEFYNLLVDNLDIDIPKEIEMSQYINKAANITNNYITNNNIKTIQISQKTILKAIEISNDLLEYNNMIFQGKSPPAISICILYIATKYTEENIKQVIMTKSSGISTVTLRKRVSEYVELLKNHSHQIPRTLDTFLPGYSRKNKNIS